MDPDLTPVAPSRVAHVLRRTPELSGSGISWHVEEGALVLRGRVRSFYQKQVAQTVAVQLDGIARVINELEVESR
jgi:osmotically-inducible protein OsmY